MEKEMIADGKLDETCGNDKRVCDTRGPATKSAIERWLHSPMQKGEVWTAQELCEVRKALGGREGLVDDWLEEQAFLGGDVTVIGRCDCESCVASRASALLYEDMERANEDAVESGEAQAESNQESIESDPSKIQQKEMMSSTASVMPAWDE